MNPLTIFILLVFALFAGLGWFLRGTLNVLAATAADHARSYAVAYLKISGLGGIAFINVFNECLVNLPNEQARFLPEWIWVVPLFTKPVSALLAVLVAFLDRSVARATEARTTSNPPFARPTA